MNPWNASVRRCGALVVSLVAFVLSLDGASAVAAMEFQLPEHTVINGSPLVGQPSPPIELAGLRGTPIGSGVMRGHVVVLTFWASWCTPCRDQEKVLLAVAHRWRLRGVRVIGASTYDSRREAASYRRRQPVPWRNGFDRGYSLARKFEVASIPVAFIIDRRGMVRASYLGVVRRSDLNRQLSRILRQ